ncbi:MAG: glutamate racemase [Thermodesulfovibrionales bacterium]|jgi:glutamate racemase|nr:glutamate racemase [Thermodesulfovibrionales bacterium]
MSYQPIGIFDSGVGGLTVLKEVSRILPSENIIYLGDTARVPYGIRSAETVTRYSFECTEFLLRQDIKLLIVACNTVSAISLKEIREKVSIPVIGVIEPGARAAVNSTKNRRIGIIGTEATIKSSAYLKAIKALDKDIEVFGLPCPLFVPLVEEGWTDGIIARLVVEKYLKDMMYRGVDTLVLGCTHYPLLKGVIQDVMNKVCLVDSAIETAKVVRDILEEQRAKSKEQRAGDQGRLKFYVTDSTEKFVNVGERFLGKRIDDIEKINLGR